MSASRSDRLALPSARQHIFSLLKLMCCLRKQMREAYSAWVSPTSTHLQIRKASTNTETVYGL